MVETRRQRSPQESSSVRSTTSHLSIKETRSRTRIAVGCEFHQQEASLRKEVLFVGTPLLEALRLSVSRIATYERHPRDPRKKRRTKSLVVDVKRAFVKTLVTRMVFAELRPMD